ncbi:MAG: hypothetical protein IPH48_10920 [bacterium]|nr:hypothetical protein [bacterium]
MFEQLKRKMRTVFFDRDILKLMSLTVLAKPLGLASQVLMAKYFGAGIQSDAYILSIFVVNFLTNTISQVFNAVTVPYVTSQRHRFSSAELHGFINALIVVSLIPVAVFAVLAAVKASWFVTLAAPNAPEETRRLAIDMLRWMALFSVLATMIEALKAVMNANRSFIIPASMPLINSGVMLGVLVLSHESLGIWALPAAYVVSNLLQSLAIVISAFRKDVVAWVLPKISRSDLRELWNRASLVLLATILHVSNLFVDKMFASGLVAGSVSAIAYSSTLTNFGVQIFQFSLATVMFTRMSEFISAEDMTGCSRYLNDNVNRLARIAVPICLAIALTSHELVRVLYQRDAFSSVDTTRTAGALSMYMLGLPALLINLVVARVFHAMKKLGDKVWLALQYLLTSILGNFLLVGPLQLTGLAISSSLAINIHLALSVFVLSRYRVGLAVGQVSRSIITYYAIGAVTWAIFEFSGIDRRLASHDTPLDTLDVAAIGAVRGLLVLVIYGLLLVGRCRLTMPRQNGY